jgi:hypothetical protein
MDMFWFVAGACVGALVIIFAILGIALWSLCSVSGRSKQLEPAEWTHSIEDDPDRWPTVVGPENHGNAMN